MKRAVVRVMKINADEFDQVREGVEKYVGRLGLIDKVLVEPCTVGESNEDPLLQIRFRDGSHDAFWTEELALVRI